MKVIALVLALLAASVAEELPKHVWAKLYPYGESRSVGTFVFDKADSTEMLLVNARNVTLTPGEYVVMAHTVTEAQPICFCPTSLDQWRICADGNSVKIFTMKVNSDGSYDVHNLSTSATISLNDSNSIIPGVMAIYNAEAFKDDQSTPTRASVACGDVMLEAAATLYFTAGAPHSVAGKLRFVGSSQRHGAVVDGSLYGFPPARYVMIIHEKTTNFADSLTIPNRWREELSSIVYNVENENVQRVNPVRRWHMNLKPNVWGSIIGHPVAFYKLAELNRQDDEDSDAIAFGYILYV